MGRLAPRYRTHGHLMVLSWGAHILKRFSRPARNQETLLAAAEELRWPVWFDDPLPPGGGSAGWPSFSDGSAAKS